MSAILTASRLRGASLVLLAVAMTGCGTIKGWFNDTKKENIEPPTPLAENFAPSVSVQRVWGERIGKGVFRPCHVTCAHHQKRQQTSVALSRDALGRSVRLLDSIDHWL